MNGFEAERKRSEQLAHRMPAKLELKPNLRLDSLDSYQPTLAQSMNVATPRREESFLDKLKRMFSKNEDL